MALAGLGHGSTELLHVPTPDYKGGLEQGYAAAVERLAGLATTGPTDARRVNILAGPGLTPADVNEVRDIAESFGLEPVILPDLSALDGSRPGFSPLASGGITVDSIRAMGTAAMTVALGQGLARAASIIEKNCDVPSTVLDGISGLAGTDRFMEMLCGLSGGAVPARLERQRRALVDGMRDAVARVAGTRVILAQEVDTAVALSALLSEAGARVTLAVVPADSPAARSIRAEEVMVGDYGCIRGEADLLIAGSHGRMAAGDLGIPHLEWGFPVFERLGHNASLSAGYRGGLEMVNRIGNKLMEATHESGICHD
jgi:nitrogenase molybdenum-iron protein alpha/beta subunit